MSCILKDELHSVLSSTPTFITGKNLRSWLNEAGWPNRSWLASVKEFVCFINKFSTYFAVSDYINFWTCLLGWLVSWKWAGSVSILTFNHGIAHPRKLDRFFFVAQAPCNQDKVFNKQELYWIKKWVDSLCDRATHIGEIKKLDPLTKTTLATRPVCPIWSTP